jgi:DNA polymerase-3 subunit epsilon
MNGVNSSLNGWAPEGAHLPHDYAVADYTRNWRANGGTIVAVVDTETTGTSKLDEVISIGVVMLEVHDNFRAVREIEHYYGLREPGVPINRFAQAVHGISLHELRGQALDMRRLEIMLCAADCRIAHNAAFDRRMLAPLFPALAQNRWACSVHALKARWARLETPSRTLDDLCRQFGIVRPRPHNALADVRALVELLSLHADHSSRAPNPIFAELLA